MGEFLLFYVKNRRSDEELLEKVSGIQEFQTDYRNHQVLLQEVPTPRNKEKAPGMAQPSHSQSKKIEQVMGIEPTYSAWKADVLPLNHTCKKEKCPKLESNQRHEDFQSSALPTELSGHRTLGTRLRDNDYNTHFSIRCQVVFCLN